jgi:uncharacterized membrane protein
MTRQAMRQFVAEHWGKITGGLIGLTIGLCIIVFGFWRSVFIFFCVALGVFVGRLFDRNERLRGILNRFWPEGD